MVKFIIVEDEKEYQATYKKIIDKIMFKNDTIYEIQCYEGYTQTLQNLIKDPADSKIYIMDVEVKAKNQASILHVK